MPRHPGDFTVGAARIRASIRARLTARAAPAPGTTRTWSVLPALVLLIATCCARGQPVADARRSDALNMTPELQAMQRDDAQNPAMLWVAQGQQLWDQPAGAAGRSCAACHGEPGSLRGAAVRYPAFDASSGRAINLAQRINFCRTRHQQASPLAWESDELLALESLVARQSRGLPLAPDTDARLQPARALGRALFSRRMGQLNLSCMNCHDERAGQHLGAAAIPQAHPVSYPQYRLEWQALGSLQRRLRNCQSGVRAQPWPLGSDELVALELYLTDRARGMSSEAPGIRP